MLAFTSVHALTYSLELRAHSSFRDVTTFSKMCVCVCVVVFELLSTFIIRMKLAQGESRTNISKLYEVFF